MLDKPVENHGRFRTQRGLLRLRYMDRRGPKAQVRRERLQIKSQICFQTSIIIFGDLG